MTESNAREGKATAGPVGDWSGLQGVAVRITKNGHFVRSGHVEAVTPAADVLWLRGLGVDLRAMFDKNEGYEAWLEFAANAAEPMGTIAGV